MKGPTSLPYDFANCSNTEQRDAWIKSERGQQQVSQRPRLLQAQSDGKLAVMVSSPKWIPLLNEILLDRPDASAVAQLMPHDAASLRLDSSTDGSRDRRLGNSGGFFGSMLSRFTGSPLRDSSLSQPTRYPIVPFPMDVKLKLLTEGYAVIKQHVPQAVCERAVKYINSQLGNVNFLAAMQSDSNPNFQFQFSSQQDLMNCYTPQIVGEVSELLHGMKSLDAPIVPNGCQIALRFPNIDETVPASGKLGGKQWHIDGMNKGDYCPFTVLVGVALSDQAIPFMGNLCVHSGSHYTLQEPVRSFARDIDHNSLRPSEKVALRAWHAMGAVDLGEPEQLCVERGDVVLLHQRLAHRGAPNCGCNIRQMLYFRICHKDHTILKEVSLDDLWVEFEGMKAVCS